MQAGLQMAGSFALCIGRSPFSEMEPRSGGIELKARQNGRGDPVRIKRKRQSCKQACKWLSLPLYA